MNRRISKDVSDNVIAGAVMASSVLMSGAARIIEAHASDTKKVTVNKGSYEIPVEIGAFWFLVDTATHVDSATDIDTGTVAASTAYYLYAVTDESAISFKTSLSATNPTGYDTAHSKLLGGFTTDGSKDITASTIWDVKLKVTTGGHGMLLDNVTVSSLTASKLVGSDADKKAVSVTITDGEGIDTTGGAGTLTIACEDASTSNKGVTVFSGSTKALAGTDTASAMTPADSAAAIAVSVNPRAMSQGVAMTAAASGSSGIQVADNDNINFGTGNFTLVWKGSLPDWTPSGNQYLFERRSATIGQQLVVLSGGTLNHYIQGAGGVVKNFSSAAVLSFTDGTSHEIVSVITRETAAVDGLLSIYLDGVLWESSVITAGSGGDIDNADPLAILGTGVAIRTAGTCSFAATYNRALTAAEVLDLYRNGIAEADKWGSQTSIITGNDSTFAGASNWENVNIASYDETTGGVLTVTVNAANQCCRLLVANATTVVGKKYRLTFTVSSIAGALGWRILSYAGVGSGFDFTTDGTHSFEFTALDTGGLMLYALSNNSSGVFDNFLLYEIGATLALEPENIGNGVWYDSSKNNLTATMPATGWSLTRSLKNQPVLTNLLTNSQWMACSGSTLCEVTSGAAPVTDGANAALVNNLLTNGGFDSAVTSWAVGDATLSSDAGGKTGNCCTLTVTGANLQYFSQPVTLEARKLYKLSAYVKSGTSGDEAFKIYTDGTGFTYSSPQISGTSSSSWTLFTAVFENINATDVTVLKDTATAGTMLFDSVTLYEVTPGYVAADTLAPDGWAKGVSCDICRQHNDAAYTKNGSFYSAKTTVAGTDAFYWPTANTDINHLIKFRGRTVALGCWVYASAANTAKLGSYDGSSHSSSFHTGSSTWEWLEFSYTVSSSAAQFDFQCMVNAGTAYFSQPMLVYGSSCGQGNFAPISNERIGYQTPFALTGYSAAVPADATINLEAASSGIIGKGVKKVYGYHIGTNSAAAKYLKLCTSSGVVNSHLISQVAAGPVSSGYEVKCDANGDMYIDVEDANWSAYSLYVTGIET